ncbi:MAG: bifunctional hydroxymethylpyrimidine kinase/phosphomethylpyrimidine kinase [Clostridiales bacterium]|nr:bifunctional hydroxymethylpyrimidine kinase/phosphomethylpyrimidine kinase [Clostridiales bacterium]
MKTALTIAGSDCSGGAGIQADLKTFAAHNVYGMSIITAVVAENTTGVLGIERISKKSILQQFKAVFEDIFPDSVKIGMLSERAACEAVYEGLEMYTPKNVVIDPVLYAKDGTALTDGDNMDFLIKNIFTKADLLTPNIPEAEKITGLKIKSIEDMKKACREINSMGIKAVLLKGGHFEGEPTDILFDGGDFKFFRAKRINTKNTHGTGCTLSSAAAANLAAGKTMEEAVFSAKKYINTAIENSLSLGKGNGPLNHMYSVFKGDDYV